MQSQSQDTQPILISRAAPDDLPAVLKLLEANKLPPDGLADHFQMALIARAASGVGPIVGCAALELYGGAALLRSVSVTPALQRQGLGHRLTQAALDMARAHGVTEVYLLTETAGGFFPRFGFERITRDAVPDTVKQSVEFTTACPDSALVMRVRLLAETA
jgi:amino-acid N-acetyltransferase